MEYSLSRLDANLRRKPYTTLTEEEILRQARARTQTAYNQKRLAARQGYEIADGAMEREARDAAEGYARQAEAARAATADSVSALDRGALARGMQRSSYTGATRQNALSAGEETLARIGLARADAEADIGQRRTQAARHLAETLAGYDLDYETDVASLADTLREREYDRGVESVRYANEMERALYEYANREREQALTYQKWMMQWNAAQQGRSGGGSGSSGTPRKAVGKSAGNSGAKAQAALAGLWEGVKWHGGHR